MQLRPEYLLLPANRGFITFTLMAAFVLNILPWGRYNFVPDFLALVIVFWNIHQPRKLGMGISFVCGLFMDVHNANLLGEHALAYTLLSYGAISLHRRVLSFKIPAQMIHVLPLFLLAQAANLAIRVMAGYAVPDPSFFLQSIVTTLLWPIADLLLLAPQRRSIDRDENRPI